MLNLKQFKGFSTISGDRSREANCLLIYSITHDIPVQRVRDRHTKCPEGFVPVGSVEWCLNSLGRNITPNYYPEWLSDHLYRKVWQQTHWPLERVFIKPSDKDKRFTGFVTTGTYRKKKKPPFWCSNIVKFQNEWRYYISNGEVLCDGWYDGDEINTPDAPLLDIQIPLDYCGAVDFGLLTTGELALVEANHPFACGWYGTDHGEYFQWLVDGWEYMLNH